jgi:hypothetical protein
MTAPTLLVELSKVTTAGYHDISSYVKSFNLIRGRSRQLDKFESGQLNIVFNNNSRAFDPLYTSSPFYGAIVPKANIKITVGGYIAFSGAVTDWSLTYDVSGQSDATLSAADLFSVVSQQIFTISSTIPGTLGDLFSYSGVSEPELGINWSTSLGTVTGIASSATSHTILGLNVLDFWQTLERSERGYLFVGRDGLINFYGRKQQNNTSVVLADDGTGISYVNLNVIYGTELLYNKAIMSRVDYVNNAAGTVTAKNASSGTAYGYSVYEDSGLIYDTDAELTDATTTLVVEYGDPEYRFDSASIALHGLSAINQNALLALDLTDNIEIKFTPNGVGSALSKLVKVIGIELIGEPGFFMMTMRFEEIYNGYLVLDSDSYGLLDSYRLYW